VNKVDIGIQLLILICKNILTRRGGLGAETKRTSPRRDLNEMIRLTPNENKTGDSLTYLVSIMCDREVDAYKLVF
jgi:hypothetical protein